MKKVEDRTPVIRTARFESKAQAQAYLDKHKPTGLTKLAVEDYLNGEEKRKARREKENIIYKKKEEN